MQRRVRRCRLTVGAIAVAVVVTGVALTRVGMQADEPETLPSCTATVEEGQSILDLDQAANAATIAAIGKREGMPNHAVTVALATAFQESRLRNLDYGDRDSVGLFQQRPSQGWGTPDQLVNPRYAARAFYRALNGVEGWAIMAVTDAAQRVQRSAAPDAYAQWEPQARALARVLTGEVPGGFACDFVRPRSVAADDSLGSAMTSELGSSAIRTELTVGRGWTMASWLVAHAHRYRITEVIFAGLRWTASSGGWETHSPARMEVQLRRAGVRTGAELQF